MPIPGYFGEDQIVGPLPVNALPGIGFIVCPLVWQGAYPGNGAIAMIYRLAYEQAQAALRPGWYERLSMSSAN
jgi:hypothetical protein